MPWECSPKDGHRGPAPLTSCSRLRRGSACLKDQSLGLRQARASAGGAHFGGPRAERPAAPAPRLGPASSQSAPSCAAGSGSPAVRPLGGRGSAPPQRPLPEAPPTSHSHVTLWCVLFFLSLIPPETVAPHHLCVTVGAAAAPPAARLPCVQPSQWLFFLFTDFQNSSP